MSAIHVTDAGGNDSIECVDLDNGYRAPRFITTSEEIIKIWNKLPNFQSRDDDILLASFAKTGTNWMFEVIGMILQKKAERIEMMKLLTNIEATHPEPMDDIPSPRVLNTHIHVRFIPQSIKEKQLKTVLIIRNPKDVAVSYYNHMCAIRNYGYSGKWENWLPTYIQGKFEFGTYESWLLEWEEAIKNKTLPIHLVYYEDLKQKGPEEIKRLARFLNVDIDENLCQAINDMCSFDKMKKDKLDPVMKKAVIKDDKEFFRKGQVGDWKNWFTVAQNEMFDEVWQERMKDSTFKFKYNL